MWWCTLVIKWDEVGNLMLIGEYTHTLDDKRRISLPSKFRKEIGKTVVLTKGLDHCIFIYSQDQWKKISQKLSELSLGSAASRSFGRFMLSGAVEVDTDSAGRILIPDFLKDFAGLAVNAVLTGVYNRLEIWDEARWKEYRGRIENEADALAEKLGEVGMI